MQIRITRFIPVLLLFSLVGTAGAAVSNGTSRYSVQRVENPAAVLALLARRGIQA